MAGTNDRIEEALAAHLDHLEMGGPEPDTGHLTESERQELQELIDALDLTEGMAFGLGRGPEAERPASAPVASIAPGEAEEDGAVVEALRTALSPDVRIEPDPGPVAGEVGGIDIRSSWIVGTFGGRVRVWLLAVESAQEVEQNPDCLADLGRIFRFMSEAAAIALVGGDLSCLVVRPEDTGPQIRVPSGSLESRRYRRAIEPVGSAVAGFLDQLIPYWDPVPVFEGSEGMNIDLPAVSAGAATAAIERQRGIGGRARKGNPKKEALLELGDQEIAALTKLARGLFDGRVDPGDVADEIEELAKDR